jgi:hypothetical protein
MQTGDITLSQSGDIFLISALFFGVGLLVTASGLWKYLVAQKIRNTPLSKVSSASVGLVALTGKARLSGQQLSPVSNVPCAFWRVFGSYYKSGKHSGWEGIYTAESKNPISLDDGTGTIPVLPEGATIVIPSHSSFEGYISEQGLIMKESATMDPQVLKFIESLDMDTKEAFYAHKNEKILVNEYVIRENDPLFVLGTAMPADDVPGLEAESLVVRQGTGDSTMYISDSSERDFMNELFSHLYWPILGGIAIAGICLYVILSTGGD